MQINFLNNQVLSPIHNIDQLKQFFTVLGIRGSEIQNHPNIKIKYDWHDNEIRLCDKVGNNITIVTFPGFQIYLDAAIKDETQNLIQNYPNVTIIPREYVKLFSKCITLFCS